MSEEWTFVSHNKRSSKPARRRRHDASSVNGGEGGGLYRASASNNNAHNDGDGMKRFFAHKIDHNFQATQHQQPPQTEAEQMKDKERIRDAILESISVLEKVLTSDASFSSRLIAALRGVTTSSSANKDGGVEADNKFANKKEEGNVDDDDLNLREIVAYGIGNFAATTSFSAPMLQLACVLFLRRCAAAASSCIIDSNEEVDVIPSDDDTQSIFKREQNLVPIYYYEPCILPVERDLLESVFHVHVLDNNEFGKLHVQSMRQGDDTAVATTNTSSSERVSKSLFYMPHCPMRLYSTVLWSHWENLDSILIFGNSFQSYDERILSSERRNDPTNGLLRIIPCTNEVSIKLQGNRRRGYELYDALNHYLETAFNDCNIISFSVDNEISDRPDEYFASQDPDNRELL